MYNFNQIHSYETVHTR